MVAITVSSNHTVNVDTYKDRAGKFQIGERTYSLVAHDVSKSADGLRRNEDTKSKHQQARPKSAKRL